MSAIPSLDPTSLSALNASIRGKGKASLDQADFLKLMTTQLKTQDPFQPMDTQAMVTQMQQLSQTSGIAEMSAQLKAIAATLASSRLGDTAGWIGRNALVAGDFVHRDTTGSYEGQVTLDAPADSVTIDMLDVNGLIVHSETHGPTPSGALPFGWHGRGEGSVAAGPLKVRVIARAADRPVATTTAVWTPVTAVQSPAGGAAQRLVTPNGLIAPDAAIRLG